MTRWNIRILIGVLGCALVGGVHRASAQQTMLADLETIPTNGTHAAIPQKIKLSDSRPATVTQEPVYRHKPQYGTITLGDGKDNRITVVLDADPTAGRPYLYVDGNENGDLTDDPPIRLMPEVSPDGIHKEAPSTSAALKKGMKLVASVPVIARYKVAGRGGAVASTLLFTYWDGELYYNREYGRVGKLTVDGRTFKFGLIDQAIDGRFDQFKHDEDEPAKVSVLVDNNGDGEFDPRHEAFDAAKPFRIGGVRYQIQSIDSRGLHVAFVRLTKPHGLIDAANLVEGADAIPFDTDTMDRKTIQFPDDYDHKIVLLHFWATWWRQAKEEAPYLVAAYTQFHGGGFEILNISLDKNDKDQVITDFCKKYGVTWPQVYDGGYFKSEIPALYKIQSIPQSFLVDGSTGKILAMGNALVGTSLQQTVAQAMLMLRR